MNPYLILALTIIAEVIATSSLKASAGFTKLWPSVIVILGYGSAFYGLSLVLKTIPVGIAYAIWSGAGTALVALVGWAIYRQALDAAAVLGIGLIIAGVVVLNVFSKSAAH